MAFVFGAGTGDDLNGTSLISGGGDASSGLVCGWFYPTTLTAGRGLWSFGNVFGVAIDSTTDELRLYSDNTTDGEWTTSGVDLAVNSWKFIAIMWSFSNTGPSGAWRVWVGDANTPPVEAVVTNAVSPSGNFTGSQTLTFGNLGTGTVAFQGEASQLHIVLCTETAGTGHGLFISSYGSISDAEAGLVARSYVWEFWGGHLPRAVHQIGARNYSYEFLGAWNNNQSRFSWRRNSSVSTPTPYNATWAVNGVTASQNNPPRFMLDHPYHGRMISRPVLELVVTTGGGSPSITSVTPSSFDTGKTGVVIAGTGFGGTQGSSTVTIGGVAQTVTAWSDTSITFTSVRSTQSMGNATLTVTKV